MNIEEMERELEIARNQLQQQEKHLNAIELAMKEAKEQAKKADDINTYIPEINQKYYYPTCNQTSGKYEPCETTGANGYQSDAFRTEEQAEYACKWLNKIMPALKYAIESDGMPKYESGFLGGYKFSFEIYFGSKEHFDNAYKISKKVNNENT